MSIRFASEINSDAVHVRLVAPKGTIPTCDWSLAVPSELLTGVDLATALEAADCARLEPEYLFLPHAAAADLTSGQARSLGLEHNADVAIDLRIRGTLGKQGYGADLRWRRRSGSGVIVGERRGAFLKIGSAWQRLPKLLFDIVEAIEHLNNASFDLAEQLSAQAALQNLLSGALDTDAVAAKGVLGTMSIAVADAFSLDLKGSDDRAVLVPILFRAGSRGDTPLLSPEQQEVFGEKQFHAFGEARGSYALGGNAYVVLSKPLTAALQIVRRFQARSASAREAFFANPRASLRSALWDDLDESALEDLFRETKAYSDRVIGLGLWIPRTIPWLALPATDWMDGVDADTARVAIGGITVGDQRIELSPYDAVELRDRIVQSMGTGSPFVPHLQSNGEVVNIPATPEVVAAIARVAERLDRYNDGESTAPIEPLDPNADTDEEALQPMVLLIRANEDAVDFEAQSSPRSGLPEVLPSCLNTLLKPHQVEAVNWLQRSWSYGNPGVLLADDMGLGKTLEALVFLAWLRENMLANRMPRRPLLIVAPTGLLKNWTAEHAKHLTGLGLGICLEAYDKGLKALKQEDEIGRAGLDRRVLEKADWVLTTYETLRDYIVDFGAVRFATLLFDEAQKIKNPGVRLTDAAKAVKADFTIAMTGTPVENRLADIWCVTDTVHPAFLGDLKTFSEIYEKEQSPDGTQRLRALLDQPRGNRPPIMLRRLKRDRLPELPTEHEILRTRIMPPEQFEAYARALDDAVNAEKPGAMLVALQAFRRISLHPDTEQPYGDEAFIAQSARLLLMFETLDDIAKKGERALIFLEDLATQARLTGIIQRRYRLRQPPMVINGAVAGGMRQDRVDSFQNGADEFDVMILSPKAGGVGLTLTKANHVIHLTRWWNPAVEDQCTGRALRIGQTRPVFVHIPQATLPNGRRSFDENLHALLDRKRRLSADALLPSELTDDDKEDLFRQTAYGTGSMTTTIV